MITSDRDLWLVGIAWRLDRLRWVPDAVLAEIVARSCTCLWVPSTQVADVTIRPGSRVNSECVRGGT